MAHWIRFARHEEIGFGTLRGDTIIVHAGDMFDSPKPTARSFPMSQVRVLTPTVPSKMLALWNNFHALAVKLNVPVPSDPLYLLKASTCYLASGETIERPPSYSGKAVFEGELGIIIGKKCWNVSPDAAEKCIFGYTCVNDVTAADIINKDPTFAQWVRAKSFDAFGPFGPVIATDVNPETLVVRTILNGQERQHYPLNDMIFSPKQLVSRISHDMTLLPGDLICCGTSLGVGAMREPHNVIEVEIEGIGKLTNTFVNKAHSARNVPSSGHVPRKRVTARAGSRQP